MPCYFVAGAKTIVESLAIMFPICLKLFYGIPYGGLMLKTTGSVCSCDGAENHYLYSKSVIGDSRDEQAKV